MTDEIKSAWVSSSGAQETQKPWGTEISWSGFGGIHGKTLFIQEGHRTSLKYNLRKTEVLMVRSGTVEATFGDERTLENPNSNPFKTQILNQGDSLLVQSCCPYRIRAITNCEIFEIGDSAKDTPIRIEDDYGRIKNEDA